MNNIEFLRETVALLSKNSVNTWVFGGWAEELLGMINPREHKDLDLLFPANNFGSVDEFLRKRSEVKEILGKHFAHKRAFTFRSIMVEIFLVEGSDRKPYTNFWGEKIFYWPGDTFAQKKDTLKVASHSSLEAYRKHYAELSQ